MKTFVLTEDQAMLLELAHNLVSEEIKPHSEEVDHTGHCANGIVAPLAEAGLLVCTAPETLGGAGLDAWSQTAVTEEIARACASTAWAAASSAQVAECILRYGTEAQAAAVVPALVSGRFAAPAGGNGAVYLPADGGYVLNRTKKTVPNAGNCDFYLVRAGSGCDSLWFVVEGSNPGIRASKGTQTLGMKGCAIGELTLSDCFVPESMVIRQDFAQYLACAGALDMAAIAVGIAQGAMDEAIAYINQRVQFGKTISQFQNTQFVMAELQAKVEAARALVWNVAHVKDSGEDYAYAAAVAKLVATDTASVVTRKCVQFMGGYGYSREYPVERKMRDAKMTELCGGSSAAQKTLIANEVIVL